MLPRTKRLTRATFGAVAGGKRAVSAHFSVTYAPSAEPRAAAVVSKKVARLSVDRHALKRRMLDAAHPHLLPGRSFIIFARKGSTILTYSMLTQEIDTLLRSLRAV